MVDRWLYDVLLLAPPRLTVTIMDLVSAVFHSNETNKNAVRQKRPMRKNTKVEHESHLRTGREEILPRLKVWRHVTPAGQSHPCRNSGGEKIKRETCDTRSTASKTNSVVVDTIPLVRNTPEY